MRFDTQKKQEVVQQFATHTQDTGSTQVQIAILSERIKALAEHLQTHKADHSSKRGLLELLAKRRNLLRYLQRTQEAVYKEIIQRLGLKK